MNFSKSECDIFIPDGIGLQEAFSRITHVGIGAHQDDLEIMAYDGVLKCFGKSDMQYMGVTVTNGAGSPRDGIYQSYTDEQMQGVRRTEQRKAAVVGEYGACVQLAHSSSDIKNSAAPEPVEDLIKLLELSRPDVVYTHNLADKHDTHVAVALRVISAIRALPAGQRPSLLYGCEVWRGLDWLCDTEKVVFDVSAHPSLAAALVGVYDSQVAGGKRYDRAAIGRRQANATFLASHFVDDISEAIYAVDMTPLIKDDSIDPADFILERINNFKSEITERVSRFI